MIAAGLGIAGLIAAVDRTQQVFAARHVVAAGDELTAADLRPVAVRLGSLGAAYVTTAPRPGTIATRSLVRGELVPRSALGTAAGRKQTSVVIGIDREPPAAVAVGAAVDVWAAAARTVGADGAKFDAPRVLTSAATVVRVERDGGLGASGGVSVEVRVPTSAAAALLSALANGAAITLLPAAG